MAVSGISPCLSFSFTVKVLKRRLRSPHRQNTHTAAVLSFFDDKTLGLLSGFVSDEKINAFAFGVSFLKLSPEFAADALFKRKRQAGKAATHQIETTVI